MHPILIRIPLPGWNFPLLGKLSSLPIYSYGVMLGLSIVVGWYLTLGLAERDGLPKEEMANNYVFTALMAILGSRVLYVVTNLDEFHSFADIFAFRRGGLVAYGGFLGGFLGSYLYLKRKRIPLLPWADVAVPSLATGLFLTRIGCYLFGCDFGKRLPEGAPGFLKWLGTFPHWPDGTLDHGSGSPAWFQHYEQHLVSIDSTTSMPVHPTQIYESLVGLSLFGLMMFQRKHQRFRGQVFLLFTFAYGFLRYGLEIIRDDAERGEYGPQMPEHVLVPGGLLLMGLGYVFFVSRAVENKNIRALTQVLSLIPAVGLFLYLKPPSFAEQALVKLSTSQWVALITGLAAAFAYMTFFNVAKAHPDRAMALGLEEFWSTHPEHAPAEFKEAQAEAEADVEDDAPVVKKKKKKKRKPVADEKATAEDTGTAASGDEPAPEKVLSEGWHVCGVSRGRLSIEEPPVTLAIPRTSLRPRLRTGDVLLYAATAALALSVGAGCAATGGRGRLRPPSGVVEANQVGDDRFAESVHTLLRDGNPTKERQALLEGVVRRQLAHAADRLKAKQRDRGMASVVGALYLVRSGELRAEMIDPVGDQALAGAIDVIAATGDEGRSMALYDLRRLALPQNSPARQDAEEHLAALDKWVNDIAQNGQVGPTEAAGLAQRRMTARALLFPSDEALKDAVQSTSRWVDAGIRFQQDFRAARERPKREEAVEGFRAVSSGAATLAALFLRSGDAQGAVEAISSTSVEQVTPPGLFMRLNAAAKPKDASSWRELLQLFGRPESRDEETAVDRALLQAATFGIAIEAYRREPTSVEITMVLASALNAYGMPEAGPPVLADAAKKHPDAPVVSSMLDAVSRSIAQEEQEEDPASALRTFAAAGQLLEIADGTKGKMAVTPARLRLVAAGVSARAGELAMARGLLGLALKDGPSVEALHLSADVEQKLGNSQAALDRLRELAQTTEARHDRILEAEARLAASDVHREMGARDKARDEAVLALAAVLDARKLATRPAQIARAERTLARVLERMGDDVGAARATERALTASRGDAQQLAPTALEGIARAFVAKDLPAARRVAHAAVGAGLRDDEIVYVGIWLQMLERAVGATSDGTASKAFAEVGATSGWASRLSAWATGKLPDVDLASSARTPAQRAEASFYRALAQRVAGQTAAADSSLREIAKSSVVELMESQIARDLLAGSDRQLPGPAPAGLSPP